MSAVKPVRLGDLITFKRGYDLPEKNRVFGAYPVISSAGVSGYHNEYKAEGEGVVTGRYGTLGKMYYVDGKYWPHNTALYVKDFKENDPQYIYYLLTCIGHIGTSDKSAVPGVNRNELHDMAVPAIEDKNTQVAVRMLLKSLDKKIELNNKINAELEAMAKLIYDYWFVQFDFPNTNGKPYKSSGGKMVYNEELKRKIPDGWDVKELGAYAQVKKGELITKKTVQSGKVKVVAAGINFSYFHSTANYKKNTITLSGSGASAGYINFWREPIFASDCITVRGSTDAETLLVLHYLKLIQEYIFKQARGSAQPHVYPTDISILKYVVPPECIMKRFGNSVLSFNEKIAINQSENEQLIGLRDWLLPMLMNGQVTVNDS